MIPLHRRTAGARIYDAADVRQLAAAAAVMRCADDADVTPVTGRLWRCGDSNRQQQGGYMGRRLSESAVLVLVLSAFAGCLLEGTLDRDGGGTLTVKYRLTKADQFANAKKRMQGPNVTLTNATLDAEKWATFDLKLADVTKLPTAPFFEHAKVSLSDDDGGTKTLSIKFVNPSHTELPKEMVDYFGNTVTVKIHLPGEVVKSNATKTEGQTVIWNYGLNEFGSKPEVDLTATFKRPS
jgi:hypothetical protein